MRWTPRQRVSRPSASVDAQRTDTVVSDTTLEEFAEQLPPASFVRLHRSYIVNLQQITGLTVEARRHFVKLADLPIKIPVSRGNVPKLKALL